MRNALNFNAQAQDISFATTIGISTLLAAALTLNAKDTEELLRGVSIADVANPSFKDGTAPMLSHPVFTAAVLEANQRTVLVVLQNFEEEFDRLVTAIEDGNEAVIKFYIEHVDQIRKAPNMPAHRAPDQLDNNLVRPSLA